MSLSLASLKSRLQVSEIAKDRLHIREIHVKLAGCVRWSAKESQYWLSPLEQRLEKFPVLVRQ